MFRFAVPILGALILQTVYGIVDTFVISRYAGVAAISGISSGSQFMGSVTGIIAAFATAITVLVAQQKGAKNQEELGKPRLRSFFSVPALVLPSPLSSSSMARIWSAFLQRIHSLSIWHLSI